MARHDNPTKLQNIFVDFEILTINDFALPPHYKVIIEVDEYAHISYSTKEAPQERSIGLDFDSSRARRIYETFEDDEVLIFIRLNPDRYSINKKRVSGIRYQERVKALKDWLAGLDRDLEPDFYLAYFYYPIFNGKLVELSKDYFDEESKEHILEVIN